MKQSQLKSVVKNLQGRFVSLLVANGEQRKVYSAKIVSTTPSNVVFLDTNGGLRRVPYGNVLRATCRVNIAGKLASFKGDWPNTKTKSPKYGGQICQSSGWLFVARWLSMSYDWAGPPPRPKGLRLSRLRLFLIKWILLLTLAGNSGRIYLWHRKKEWKNGKSSRPTRLRGKLLNA